MDTLQILINEDIDENKLNKIFDSVYAKPQETLLEHVNALVEQLERLVEFGYIKDSTIIESLKVACKFHDIGKLNPIFQSRIINKYRFDSKKEIGHNILSAYLLNFFHNLEIEEKLIVLGSVLNHHRYVSNFDTIYKENDLIMKNLFLIKDTYFEIDEELFVKKLNNFIKPRMIGKLKKIREQEKYILVKGLLHKCDYSASAHIDCETKNDFLYEKMNNLGYSWRDIQQFCLDNSEDNLIIIGSTGLGKTEASLLWGGDNKIFYVLPLRTAINAMYERFTEIIGTEYHDKVGLLHGETANVYLTEFNDDENSLHESEKFYEYYGRTKNMSLPITVATPDQLFDFVFKYPGYELKLATFSYSKIIIDEIQAYSPDILAYTIHAIKRINTLGGKFGIFTATLAPFVKDLLLRHEGHEKDIEFKEEVFLTDKIRHNLKIEKTHISAEFVLDIISKRKNLNTCLIVVNTIAEAQDMYYSLKKLVDKNNIDVDILHSQFTISDRRYKEKKILKDSKYRKSKNEEKLKIWIATQIVEASLDIDFDIMFTELSELLGLFQRLGRCYRQRILLDEEPNVYIFTEINDKILSTSQHGFIDAGLYNISRDALLEKGDGIITEKQKMEIIDKYYTTEMLENTKNCKYIEEYNNKYKYINNLNFDEKDYSEVKKEFRNIISFKAIPESVYLDNSYNITELKEEIKKIKKEIVLSNDTKMKGILRMKFLKLKDSFYEYTINVKPYLIDFRNYVEITNEKVYIISYKYGEAGLEKNKDDENIFI